MNTYILRVLYCMAMIALCIWITSLSYFEWFKPKTSVLDKYTLLTDEDRLYNASLNELVRKYDESQRKIKEYEGNKTNPVVDENYRFNAEPYKSEVTLKYVIQNLEADALQLHKVRSYWLYGLAFALLGLIIYRKFNDFLGLPFMIAGFAEMVAITEPGRYGGDFSSLISTKLALSFITLVIVIVFGYVLGIMKDE